MKMSSSELGPKKPHNVDVESNMAAEPVTAENEKSPELSEKVTELEYKMQMLPHTNVPSDDTNVVVVADEVSAAPPPIVEIEGIVVPQEQLAEEEHERFRNEVEKERRMRRKWLRLLAYFLVTILVVGALATGLVCGTGKCVSSPQPTRTGRRGILSELELEARANNLTAVVNNITFSPSAISYPLPVDGASAEERALSWLIDEDEFFVDLNDTELFIVAQRYALAVIYFRVGPGSLDSTWLGPEAVCAWTGVDCRWCTVLNCTGDLSIFKDTIFSLDLQNRGLSGEIPEDIALVGDLVELLLGNNALSGIIPSSIGALPVLHSLFAQRNDLSGIPTELAKATMLQHLHLSDNFRLGASFFQTDQSALPPFLLQISSLTYLDLSGCKLFGTIPLQLKALSNLSVLFLHENTLEGSIPSELGELSELNTIFLSRNFLTGSLPSNFSNLTLLESVAVSQNKLTGTLPRELISLPSLRSVDMFSNMLNGTIPIPAGLSNLTMLHLNENSLSGPLPSNLTGLSNLLWLSLAKNRLTGTLPQSLSDLSNIEILSLGENLLSGEVLGSVLSAWTNLNTLDLHGNNLFGNIPSEIGTLTELVALNLNTNQFNGTIPTELAKLTKLGRSWVTGSKAVSILALNENRLTGSIPSELWPALSHISFLGLDLNQLTGKIPSQIALLTKLTYLNLGSNRLGGTIPTQLSRLHGLETLGLKSNGLTGSIPSSMGDLSSLRKIGLGNNSLTGEIPFSITKWTSLEEAFFYDNALEGAMPLCQVQTQGLDGLVADCTKVDCPCCTSCCPVSHDDNNIPKFHLCGTELLSRNDTESQLFSPGPTLTPLPPTQAVASPPS